MCDPITATLMAISAVSGIAGGVMQGQEADAAAKYNAKVAEDAAKQEQAAGERDAERIRRDAKRAGSATRSSYGAAGVLVDTGSPSEVAAQDLQDSELDALTAKYGGALRARSYRAEAKQQRSQGNSGLAGGLIKSGATIATSGLDTYLAYGG